MRNGTDPGGRAEAKRGPDEWAGLSFVKARVGTRDVRDGFPYPAGLSQKPVDFSAKENDRRFSNPGLLPRQEPENLSTGEEQQRGTTEETEEFMSIPPQGPVPTSENPVLPKSVSSHVAEIGPPFHTPVSAQTMASVPTGTSSAQTLASSPTGASLFQTLCSSLCGGLTSQSLYGWMR